MVSAAARVVEEGRGRTLLFHRHRKAKEVEPVGAETTNRVGSFEWYRSGEEKPSSSVGYWLTVGSTTGTLRLIVFHEVHERRAGLLG